MKLFCVASSLFAVLVLVAMGACASRPGSEATVPKPAIEKAADTKIADAGPDNGDAGEAH